jgi:hypothetical protein
MKKKMKMKTEEEDRRATFCQPISVAHASESP